MHKAIVVFEVEGGSDKGADGHRKDTMPIVNAIKEQGWEAEVIYFHPDKSEEIYTCLLYTSPSPRDATLSRMPSSA